MPSIGHKRNIYHIYGFFIVFLNKAKGDKIAVNTIIPSLEDVLKTTKAPLTLEKVVSAPRKKYNNNSEFMGDRDNETIEAYLLKKC